MDAQDIANALTLCLGGATVWLGWETRRMAIATRESVELQSRPYLAFSALDFTVAALRSLATAKDQPVVSLDVV